MHGIFRTSSRLLPGLAATALSCAWLQAQGQALSANYQLTAPPLLAEPDLPGQASLLGWGQLRLAATGSITGSGLSLEAGEHWFARAAVGRSLDADYLSVGGGYRFGSGEAWSLHVTRPLAQERLGLALRYDWRRSYLRVSYDAPVRSRNMPDRLGFSAGVRF
jgi:hypothetical protein